MLRRLIILPLAVAALAAPNVGAAQPNIEVAGPVPAWVEAVEVPAPSPDHEGAVEHLLREVQLHLEDAAAQRFVRRVYRVQNASGVQQASELRVDVPQDARLQWHYARVRRDGEVTDRLESTSQLRVIQPEASLGEGLYDGARVAILFLTDVRPGDVVEIAFTTQRPLAMFGGRYVAQEFLPLGYARNVRVSASWPEGRRVVARLHAGDPDWVQTWAPNRVVVEAIDAKRTSFVNDAPGWHMQGPLLELSEFETWGEVARWGASAYEEASAAGFGQEVPWEEIRAAGGQAEQARRALEYVQDDIRYLGLEMGEHAMLPHPPTTVAERRFGDCKDKSLLLVVILRELGIDAQPALVNSHLRRGIAERLPSPYAFNHVIVRAELDGAVVWLDGTRFTERGPVADRPAARFGRALVLRPDTEALEEIPVRAGRSPSIEIDQRFDIEFQPPRMQVDTIYRGRQASLLRSQQQVLSVAELSESFRRSHQDRGLDVSTSSPTRIEDDVELNEIRVYERYEVRDFWTDGRRDISPWAVLGRLEEPEQDRADAPFALRFPLFIRQRVSVQSDRRWVTEPTTETFGVDPLRLTRTIIVTDGDVLRVQVEMRTTADHVAPDAVAAFRASTVEALDNIGYFVYEDAGDPRAGDDSEHADLAMYFCLGLGLLVFVLVGVRPALRRARAGRRKRAFERKKRVRKGESPEAAIPVADLAEAKQKHASPRCCGAALSGGEWSTVRFDERRMAIHSVSCEACGVRHRSHYAIT